MTDQRCTHCGRTAATTDSYCVACGHRLTHRDTALPATEAEELADRLFTPGSELERKYSYIEPIGAGSMGVVLKARDRLIGRFVAVKALRLSAQGDAERRVGRALREARALGSLQHPNVVTIYEAGWTGDTVYIVMEYLRGKSLRALDQGEEPLPLATVLDYVRQIAEGLGAAHRRGVVHRDIKPDNIVVADGQVKITDFGIAKILVEAEGDLTRQDEFLGTPSYVAPELLDGRPLDGRTDLFSLGCLFYELLTRRRPFAGANLGAVLFRILHSPPTWLRDLDPSFPRCYDAILERLLAKDPAERYGSAAELVEALDAIPPSDASPEIDAVRRELIKVGARSPHRASPRLPVGCGAGAAGRGPLRLSTPEVFREGVRAYGQGHYAESVEQMLLLLLLEPDHDAAFSLLRRAVRRQACNPSLLQRSCRL